MRKKPIDESLNLTRNEEQIMILLWQKKRAFVNDIFEMMPEPKPAKTTVATFIRILEQKGFVGYRKVGRNNQYFPLVSQSEFLSNSLRRMSSSYFQNSYANIVNFFAEEGKLKRKDIEDIEQLLRTLKRRRR